MGNIHRCSPPQPRSWERRKVRLRRGDQSYSALPPHWDAGEERWEAVKTTSWVLKSKWGNTVLCHPSYFELRISLIQWIKMSLMMTSVTDDDHKISEEQSTSSLPSFLPPFFHPSLPHSFFLSPSLSQPYVITHTQSLLFGVGFFCFSYSRF